MNNLEVIWFVSWAILLGYHLLVFRIRNKRSHATDRAELPGVSIIIAVKNGSDMLIENLKYILSQDYPLFEIIVIDDHSDTGEKDKLTDAISKKTNVFLHHSDRAMGKKQALALGVEKAKYKIILCTDADCRPASLEWIKNMVNHTKGQDIVIGYSPYLRTNGFLNLMIRFETVMTGIQYLSWAMIGRPYMGVGRNMLYPRDLFLRVDPYKAQQHIPYGDDDLLIQKATANADVNVSFDKESHVFSMPAKSWMEWFRQKHRHMSAGHYYTNSAWWQPGLYGMALIMHWILLPILLLATINIWLIIFLILGILVRWFTYVAWTQKLGDRDTNIGYPLLELFYTAYLAGMGLVTLLFKKKTWN